MSLASLTSDRDALRLALQSSLRDILREMRNLDASHPVMDPVQGSSVGLQRTQLSCLGAFPQMNLARFVGDISCFSGSENSGLATDALLRAVAATNERKLLLLHASASFHKQHFSAVEESKRFLLENSCMDLVHNVSLGKPLSGLPSVVNHHTTKVIPAPDTSERKDLEEKTLEALGGNLRTMNDSYIDVSDVSRRDTGDSVLRRTRGGVSEPFPEKVHRMLKDVEENGPPGVASFFSHGRAFGIHDIDRFVSEVMPKYFKQTKWNSFTRQLNLYGFSRVSSGPDTGGYYHELFLKGRPSLCLHMRRVGVPQGEDRRKFRPKNKNADPDFYTMKRLV
jgi:hypothetical protein